MFPCLSVKEACMSISSPRAVAILGLILVFGAAVGFTAIFQGAGLAAGIRWAVALSLSAAALWLTGLYWRAIDEAAREAQKSAWLWGGSIGLAAGMLLVAWASNHWPGLAELVPSKAWQDSPMVAGALTVVLAQLAGFLSAWAFWWWRRR
jgi:hypothetical protein